ncbi:hypothetical protein [Schaalia hyovaginalis]|uniref:Uncharacterized protein n=1 Tax=Schaalia hyovaginalis TaxID=29316 RepID=A0A923E4T9_9ACTO|nr:hypothetical protein [Schaalia hyovaginalis]MBB6333661.1 hypothetical protein [Schaalia hyovaginalis]
MFDVEDRILELEERLDAALNLHHLLDDRVKAIAAEVSLIPTSEDDYDDDNAVVEYLEDPDIEDAGANVDDLGVESGVGDESLEADWPAAPGLYYIESHQGDGGGRYNGPARYFGPYFIPMSYVDGGRWTISQSVGWRLTTCDEMVALPRFAVEDLVRAARSVSLLRTRDNQRLMTAVESILDIADGQELR